MAIKPAAWTEGDINSNGQILHYYHAGSPNPHLLLIHGISDNGLCWLRLAQDLSDSYDIIMVDLRGHGRSSKPPAGYSIKDDADDVAGLISGLGLGKTAVIGHSLGASVAALLAADYPQLISCAILEDPPWYDPQTNQLQESSEGIKAYGSYLAGIQPQPLEEIAGICRENNPNWSEQEFQPWALAKKQVSIDTFDMDETPMADWPNTVRRLQAPTLLITADTDPTNPSGPAIVTPETAAQAAALNPQISTTHITGAGHNIRREQFARYLTITREFLHNICNSD